MDIAQLRDKLILLEAATTKDSQLEKVKKNLRLQTTTKIDDSDFPEMEQYFHSASRLCVRFRDNLMPEAWYKNGGINLSETGFATTKELSDFLVSQGVRLVKKPRTRKTSSSFYD